MKTIPLIGLLLSLAPLPLQAQSELGPGCSGASGVVPSLEFRSGVKTGLTIRADLSGTPDSNGFLIVGTQSSTWAGLPLPLDLGTLNPEFGPCFLYQDPAALVPFVLDSSGQALLEFKGWTAGVQAFLQVWNLDLSQTPPFSLGGFSPGYSQVAGEPNEILLHSSYIPPLFDVIEMGTGDFDGDGKIDLLHLKSNGLVVFLRFGLGDGQFSDPVEVDVSSQAELLRVADFDGDGNTDFSVMYLPFGLRVFTGDGSGSFTPNFTVGLNLPKVHELATPDLDGDGVLDLLVLTPAIGVTPPPPQELKVALGTGDGNFQSPMNVGLPGLIDHAVPVDLNQDLWMDLLLVERAPLGPGIVWTLLGNGPGTFDAPVAVSFPGAVEHIELADLDGDGFTEWIASVPSSSQVFVVSDSAAGGGVPTALPGSLVGYPLSGDLDGDGALDLVVVDSSQSTILLGGGDGTLASANVLGFGVGANPELVDMNGDGALDLVGGAIHVSLGTGTGTLLEPQESPTAYNELDSDLVDLDGDGLLDRLTLDFAGWVAWMRNLGAGELTSYHEVTTHNSEYGTRVDLDGDDYGDLVTVGNVGVTTWRGGPDGLAELKTVNTGYVGDPRDFAVADFDLDGYTDYLVADGFGEIRLVRGDSVQMGGLGISEVLHYSTPGAVQITAGLFNGDSAPDFLEKRDGAVTLYIGAGDGSFQPTAASGVDPEFFTFRAADVDQDGDSDLVLRGSIPSSPLAATWIHRSNGDGTFSPAEVIPGMAGNSFQVCDLDNDGDLDLVEVPTGRIRTSLNDGSGGFQPAIDSIITGIGSGFSLPAPADFNLDGLLDLWVRDSEFGFDRICFGSGGGQFVAGPAFSLPVDELSWTRSQVALDVNGDGAPDIVAGSQNVPGFAPSKLVYGRNLILH